MEVQLSRILDQPMSYQNDSKGNGSWSTVDMYKSDFRPFPFAALLLSVLLLLPFWQAEVRLIMQALLVVVLVAWLFMLFGTGAMARFG